MIAPASPIQVALLEQTDTYVVAVWRRLLMLVWKGQASAAGILRSRALFEPWSARQAGGAALLIVVATEGARPPDQATREAMEKSARPPGGSFKGMATLIEAEGFVAATVRAIVARMTSASAGTILRSADETAAWAARLLEDPGFTAEGFAEALRAARQG